MPEPQAPTEEQVKTANEQEFKKWEGDFDPKTLEVPYSNDEVEEDEKVKEEEKPADPKEEAETTSYEEPAPVVTVDDPGEFKPADYSFSVEIKGKSYKVETMEQAEELAEEHADDLTAKQLFALVSKGSRIEIKQERDKEKWETQKNTYDEQSQTVVQRQEIVDAMTGEFEYLVGKGLLPEIDKQYLDADWSDPEVAKQPGVKEQNDLLNYMVKENTARAKAKVKPITSIVDAFNAWQLDSDRKKEDANKVAAGEARKVAGARVAGVSASNQAPYVPKGIAVGNPNVFRRNQNVWTD